MKQEEIKDLSADQLHDQLILARKNQMDLRFQFSAGQLDNNASLRKSRRLVARLKTEIRARAINEKEPASA